MPRHKRENFERSVTPDTRFNSELVERFINAVMRKGKKSLARDIVYEAFDIIAKKHGGDEKKALETFQVAYDAVRPRVEVRPRRVGGSVYQVPLEVPPRRSRSLTFRWIIGAAKSRNDKSMSQRLAYELMDATQEAGGAIKRRSDIQRMAEANRAFAHYAW